MSKVIKKPGFQLPKSRTPTCHPGPRNLLGFSNQSKIPRKWTPRTNQNSLQLEERVLWQASAVRTDLHA